MHRGVQQQVAPMRRRSVSHTRQPTLLDTPCTCLPHKQRQRRASTVPRHRSTQRKKTLRVRKQFPDRVASERTSVSVSRPTHSSSTTSQRGVETSTSQPGKRHVLKDDLAHVVRIPFKSSSRPTANKATGRQHGRVSSPGREHYSRVDERTVKTQQNRGVYKRMRHDWCHRQDATRVCTERQPLTTRRPICRGVETAEVSLRH